MHNTLEYSNDKFDLKVKVNSCNSHMVYYSKNNVLTTKQFAHTREIIEKLVPGVLKTKCFNQHQLPFSEEIKDTEIAHLFEHIFLERLCHIKNAQTGLPARHYGETIWDWNKGITGTFDIHVTSGKEDMKYIELALHQSINVINEVYQDISYANVENEAYSALVSPQV